MKKILFLLLFTVSIYGQTLQNPTFGIVTEKNNATDSTPAYFTTSQVDGVHKKTPAALIEKTANKSDSYTASSSTTYASSKALVDGLILKANLNSTYTKSEVDSKISNLNEAYHVDFIDSGTHNFTVPDSIIIQNVYLNNIPVYGSDWSQTTTTVSVTNSIIGDKVTLTGGSFVSTDLTPYARNENFYDYEVVTGGVKESVDGYYYNVYGDFNPVGGYKSEKFDISGITDDLFVTTKVNTGTNLSMCHYYDASGDYISSQNSWVSGGVAEWVRGKCIIPDGTKYIGISNYYSPNAPEFGVLEKGTFSPSTQSNLIPFASYWKGKKLVTIGDSITYSNFWQPEIVREKEVVYSVAETQTGMGYYKPMGLGSSRIIPLINNTYVGQQSGNSIYERADDVQYYNPNLIILLGGENDINNTGTVLGTISDVAYTGGAVSSNPPTFISAYKGTLEKLILQNPTARIICLTPMWSSTAFYNDKKPFCDAIVEIAKMYSCLSINLLEESGANILNHNDYFLDGVHPNAFFGKIIGSIINKNL